MIFVFFSSILSTFPEALLVGEESNQELLVINSTGYSLVLAEKFRKDTLKTYTNSVLLKFLHFRTSDQILLFLQVNIWQKNPHHISANNAKIKVFWFGLLVFYFCGILLLKITFNPSLKVLFIRQVKFYYCQFIEA